MSPPVIVCTGHFSRCVVPENKQSKTKSTFSERVDVQRFLRRWRGARVGLGLEEKRKDKKSTPLSHIHFFDSTGERLRDFDVHVYMENPMINPSAPGTLCIHYDGPMAGGVTEKLICSNGPIRGRFVRVTNTPGEPLLLCEVQVMAVHV